jgi:hypothetical protein
MKAKPWICWTKRAKKRMDEQKGIQHIKRIGEETKGKLAFHQPISLPGRQDGTYKYK